MSKYAQWDAALKTGGAVVGAFNVPPKWAVDSRIQTPLFKATKHEWAKEFFKDGSLRIGTLWDFRRDDHSKGVCDPYEGLRFLPCDDGQINVGIPLNSKDSFLFCTSEFQNLSQFPEYDAIFKITDLRFFEEIANALVADGVVVSFMHLARMIYESVDDLSAEVSRQLRAGVRPELAAPPAAFLKDPEHARYREVRAYFELPDDPNHGRYPDFGGGASPGDLETQRVINSLLAAKFIKVPAAVAYAAPWINCG